MFYCIGIKFVKFGRRRVVSQLKKKVIGKIMKKKVWHLGVPLCGALLALGSGNAAAFDSGLLYNGDFANGLNGWQEVTQLTSMQFSSGVVSMACMPELYGTAGGRGISIAPSTYFSGLLTNTRYRLSFDAVRDNRMIASTDTNFSKPG